MDSAARVDADGRGSGARVHRYECDGKGLTVVGRVCEISLSFQRAPVREAHRSANGDPMHSTKKAEKPAILAVDDEPTVLSAMARDLRREYGQQYRVMRADSGEAALEVAREMKLRNASLALFLVDQRMPLMSGVEFLEVAIGIFPNAKRVLLTAYADTEAAIRAINEVRLNHYLMKPWDPPEELLYPTLDDLLDDWRANFEPVFEGVRLIGHRWSAEGHRIRDFLARNLISYRWLDIETDDEAIKLRELAGLVD